MGRIRTIKPEFWRHEELSSLKPETHLLAAALLNYADDEGYFKDHEKLIAAECAPLREDPTPTAEQLKSLAKIGYIRRGTGADGKKYGQVVNFSKHQRVNRPTPSEIKKLEIAWDDSGNSHTQFSEPSVTEGKGKEGNREEDGIKQSVPRAGPRNANGGIQADVVERIFRTWQGLCGHPKAKLDRKRRGRILDRLKDGYTENQLIDAIKGCTLTPHNMGENDQGQRYDDIELILRDASHVDRFIRNFHEPPKSSSPAERRYMGNSAAAREALAELQDST